MQTKSDETMVRAFALLAASIVLNNTAPGIFIPGPDSAMTIADRFVEYINKPHSAE